MSTAFYPLGMKTYNNNVNPGNYISWKGSGFESNPRGVTASNIRPLTNNDPGNVFKTGFGLPRPIKHYRKGTIMPVSYVNLDLSVPSNISEINQQNFNINPSSEELLINYNLDRYVKTSKGASLGGGSGGTGLIFQMMDSPGYFVTQENTPFTNVCDEQFCETCCQGVGFVVNYSPNKTYLTENPQCNTKNFILCCNEEKKARKRSLPTNTNLSKKYFTTLQQYRHNRCQTYEQRVFNFQNNNTNNLIKPGSPLTFSNTYVANCQPNGEIEQATITNFINEMVQVMQNNSLLNQYQVNVFINLKITNINDFLKFVRTLPINTQKDVIEVYNFFISNPYISPPISGSKNSSACKLVVYKPNNYQYATQGAVSSSTRTFKKNVSTIQTNLAGYNKDQKQGIYNLYNSNGNNAILNPSGQPSIPFIFKNKAQGCNAEIQIRFQNPKSCNNLPNDPSQPAIPNYYYAQSPMNPLM